MHAMKYVDRMARTSEQQAVTADEALITGIARGQIRHGERLVGVLVAWRDHCRAGSGPAGPQELAVLRAVT
jgi:hypothetical protein